MVGMIKVTNAMKESPCIRHWSKTTAMHRRLVGQIEVDEEANIAPLDHDIRTVLRYE